MKRFVVRVVAVSILATVRPTLPVAAAEADIRAGVVTSSLGESVLAMTGPLLAAGTTLTLITPGPPQTLRSARVVSETPNDGDDISERTPGPYYEIVSADGNKPLPQLAVAVLAGPATTRVGDTFSLHISAALPDVRARWCASYEGIHFTLWSGEPLKTQRIWHVYYAAGANLHPTCEPGDTRDEGGARPSSFLRYFAPN